MSSFSLLIVLNFMFLPSQEREWGVHRISQGPTSRKGFFSREMCNCNILYVVLVTWHTKITWATDRAAFNSYFCPRRDWDLCFLVHDQRHIFKIQNIPYMMPLVWLSHTLLAVVTVCDWVTHAFPWLRKTLVCDWRHNQMEHDERWAELMCDYYSSNRNDRL